NAEIHDNRDIFDLEGFTENSLDFGGLLRTQTNAPESFCDLNKIRLAFKACAAVAFVKEHLLPLPYHSEEEVIEDSHLNADSVLDSSCHFLNIHQEAAIACYIENFLVGSSEFSADCRRKTVAHCTQTA